MTETHLPDSSPNGETKTSPAPQQADSESPAESGSAPAVTGLPSPDRPQSHRKVPDWRRLTEGNAGLATLALVVVLIGSGAGYVGALLWPPQYAARADLLYEISTEKSTGFLREDRSLTTQVVLLNSRQVLGPVAATARMPVEDFQKQVTASVVESSEVLQVEVRAPSPEAAERWTQDIVDGYLRIASKGSESDVDGYLHKQLDDVQRDLARARVDVAKLRGQESRGVNNASTEATLQSLTDREQQLLAKLDERNIAELESSRPEIVVPPYAVPDPVSPRPAFAAATGAFTALVIAAGVVAVLARRRTRS